MDVLYNTKYSTSDILQNTEYLDKCTRSFSLKIQLHQGLPSTALVEKNAMFLVSKGLSCVNSAVLVCGSDSPVNDELSTYNQPCTNTLLTLLNNLHTEIRRRSEQVKKQHTSRTTFVMIRDESRFLLKCPSSYYSATSSNNDGFHLNMFVENNKINIYSVSVLKVEIICIHKFLSDIFGETIKYVVVTLYFFLLLIILICLNSTYLYRSDDRPVTQSSQ